MSVSAAAITSTFLTIFVTPAVLIVSLAPLRLLARPARSATWSLLTDRVEVSLLIAASSTMLILSAPSATTTTCSPLTASPAPSAWPAMPPAPAPPARWDTSSRIPSASIAPPSPTASTATSSTTPSASAATLASTRIRGSASPAGRRGAPPAPRTCSALTPRTATSCRRTSLVFPLAACSSAAVSAPPALILTLPVSLVRAGPRWWELPA